MKSAQQGMTMIELLTVVSIVGLLLGIGVPSFRYVTTSNRVSAEVNALLSDMQFARSEAVKEGQMVTVCPSTNAGQTQCDVNSTNWQNGWIVFSDVNGNQQVANPVANNILRRQSAFTSAQDTFVSDNALSFASFNREGFATAFPVTAAGYVTITLHSTPSSPQWTRCLQLFFTGMMGTQRTTDPQGNCQ
jgi:type IV fimbrial biogenesis protein FimT